MTESKFAKYIVNRPRQDFIDEWPETAPTRKVNVYADGEIIPGGYYIMGTWWYEASDEPHPDESHSHDWDEYLTFLGTNPDDPFDLCGEVELHMGGEVFTFTETTTVFIPGGVEHCPVYFKRVDRPIWFLATGPQKEYEFAGGIKPEKKK